MRRAWIGLGLVLVAGLGGGLWWASDWALGTCGAIDRWLGSSGCVARHHVPDIRPLAFASMAAMDNDHVRLFGVTDRGEEQVPIQLVLDTKTGEESGREDLPLTLTHYALIPSQFGREVAVICITNNDCDVADPQGYVLSVADGSVVEPIRQANSSGWQFPDERPRTVYGGAWLSETVSAEPDSDGSIILRNPERQEIGRFSPAIPGGRGAGPGAQAVRVSPSGQYLAMIDSAEVGISRIDIYEVASKRLINTITTEGDRKVDTNGVWSTDERHLVLFQNWDSIPSDEKGEGTDLYVFKVR